MAIKNIITFFIPLNLYYFIYCLNFGIPFFNFNEKKQKKIEKINKESIKDKNDNLIDISNYTHVNPDDPNYFYLPIFSSSDIHGHFYPEKYTVNNISYSRGGLDYLAKYVNIIKDEFQNKILYLDAGDIFQGGAESTLTNGEIIMDFLNLIKANGSTFGNHEYDNDRDFIEEKVCEAKFPFLATNIYDKKKMTKKAFGENHFTSNIYTFNVPDDNKSQVKIGVVGLTLKMTENNINGKGFEDLIFLDYKDELVIEANQLRREKGVNAVILLAHIATQCGYADNLTLNLYKPSDNQEDCIEEAEIYQLIKSLDKGVIDAVVTGHSHKEVHHWIEGVPVISPINNGLYANIMYLAFDRKNNYKLVPNEVRIEGPLPICEKIFQKDYKCQFITENMTKEYLPLVEYKFHGVKIERDPLLQPIHDKYDSIYNNYTEEICTIIGTKDILTKYSNGSFYLGNILADIYKYITGCQISIVSIGNIRTDLVPGKIPRYKIKDLQPFGNYFCTFVMNGEEVKKMMKIIQRGRKKYYVTGGIKQLFAKDHNGEYYLSDIKLFDGYKEFDLIPDEEYLIGANSFLVNGGDDFSNVNSWYKHKNLTCDYGVDYDLVEQFFKDEEIIDVRKYMDDENPRIRFID